MRLKSGVFPGLGLSIGVTAVALLSANIEKAVLGSELMDGLVIAIALGTIIRTFFGLHDAFRPGIDFASKVILEIAIVLLGASLSFSALAHAGWAMILMVAIIVLSSLTVSYWLCRALGLHRQLATLVACGNSICGNSAIVASAPAIEAGAEDVASSIAFTAALGIVVVILYPILFPFSRLSEWQYGVVAGMTVYAVPQVLAATAPVGVISVQVGTLVKLLRVLMLGPVVLILRLIHRTQVSTPLSMTTLVPWFIVGFFFMMLLRSFDLIPSTALQGAHISSSFLTVVSMAALGLSVNMRTVFASGGRVLTAGVLSILALLAMSFIGLALLPMHLQ